MMLLHINEQYIAKEGGQAWSGQVRMRTQVQTNHGRCVCKPCPLQLSI